MINKIIRDFTPDGDNNRNSEGAFITLKNGNILFAYSRYGGDGCEDGSSADIYASISTDNGESFGEPFELIPRHLLNADTLMSVSFLRMANDDVGMFFLAKTEVVNCRSFFMRSADEGKTWSEPMLCTENEGYFVVNNDRIIRTPEGRILIPVAKHGTICETDEKGRKSVEGIEPGVLYIFTSDDDGKSWYKLSEGTTIPYSEGCTTGVQEPALLQLKDGRIRCFMRNDSGRQYESYSSDNGKTWSNPVPSRFTSAESPLSVKRLKNGKIVAFWNPIPIYNGRAEEVNGVWTGARTPLVMAQSLDDGKNFSEPVAIETDDKRGFCYVAIHETDDGTILLAYCAGGEEDGCTLNRLRIRKIKIKA